MHAPDENVTFVIFPHEASGHVMALLAASAIRGRQER